LAIVAQAQSPTEPGAFLEGANGRPERSFEAFSLFGDETVERKRMADMTAEVLEYVRVRLGKDSLTDRAHELRGCAPFLTLDPADERLRSRFRCCRSGRQSRQQAGQLSGVNHMIHGDPVDDIARHLGYECALRGLDDTQSAARLDRNHSCSA